MVAAVLVRVLWVKIANAGVLVVQYRSAEAEAEAEGEY